ncbi:hypothetical protein [Pseudocolwellia sp. HL-MZ7]|uniref:hypothetical protein n=1 Tax=Pseudocolwellia sp. HL-MZ7 TaxID=3400627 RepID=UPI003CECF946
MNIIKKQGGYTMVLFLAFITAITLSGFSLYDNGIVATERIRIQNTADATAYSTMTVLTRDMNFIAYTNRAMVGNQVAIAQMVGLSSWIHMLDTAADNLNTLAQLTYAFPPVGVWLNQVTSAIQQATSAGKTGIDYFAEYFILATDNLNFVLSKAQDGFQLVTADMAFATYNKVAKANDKDIEIGLVGSTLAFGSLIQSWQDEINNNNSTSTKSSNNDELNRYKEFAGVVNDSRDPFSRNRSHDWIKKTTIIEFPGYYTKISLEKKRR